jgi:hypothetical protein
MPISDQIYGENIRGVKVPITSGSASLIHQTSALLTDEAIRKLPTTVVELVPAQTGRIAIPVFSHLRIDHSAADYLGVDVGATLQIGIGSTRGPGAMWALASTMLQDGTVREAFLPVNPWQHTAAGTLDVARGVSGPSDENALGLFADNTNVDFTGGDAANSGVVAVAFMVLDVTTFKYLTTVETGWNETTRLFS